MENIPLPSMIWGFLIKREEGTLNLILDSRSQTPRNQGIGVVFCHFISQIISKGVISRKNFPRFWSLKKWMIITFAKGNPARGKEPYCAHPIQCV